MSSTSKNSKTTANSIMFFIEKARAISNSNTPSGSNNMYQLRKFDLDPSNPQQTFGIDFQEKKKKKMRGKDQPYTCSNKQSNKKKLGFGLDKVFSPQAKTPVSLGRRSKKKKNLSTTRTFLKKRLGEARFQEILKLLGGKSQANYSDLNAILTPAEKDLGMFLFSFLSSDTPRTEASLSLMGRADSHFSSSKKRKKRVKELED